MHRFQAACRWRHALFLNFPAFIAAAVLWFLVVVPAPAGAGCTGRDLWKAMPPASRAQLEKTVAKDVFARGRFFEVRKNGRKSYIFGTMHAPAVGRLALPYAVVSKLRRAKTLLVEVTEHEEKAFFGNIKGISHEFLAKGATGFQRHFNAEDWRFIESVAQSAEIDPDMLRRARPWYVYMLMSSLGCSSGGSTLPIMDARIEAIGRSAGLRVEGLESPLSAIRSMQGFSPSQYAQMIRAEVWGFRHSDPGDLQTTRINLYAQGRVQLIWKVQMLQFARYTNRNGVRLVERLWADRMLTGRNRVWLPRILRAVEKGDAFVAVGALHLGGKGGLMRSLQRRGYKITRIEFRQ